MTRVPSRERSVYTLRLAATERRLLEAAAALGLSSRTSSVWRHRGCDNAIPFVRVSSNQLGMGGNDAN